jgi:hypothetical protein
MPEFSTMLSGLPVICALSTSKPRGNRNANTTKSAQMIRKPIKRNVTVRRLLR